MNNFIERFQRDQVKRKCKQFSLDHFALMWNGASDLHKRFLLRATFSEQQEPKHWGEYSESEQKAIRASAFLAEELVQYTKAITNQSKQFERRINKPD